MQPSRPRATSAARVPPIRTAAGNPVESVNETRFLLAMWISTLSYTPSASLIYALPNFNCFSLGIRILDMTSKLHVVIQQSVYCVSCIIHLSVQPWSIPCKQATTAVAVGLTLPLICCMICFISSPNTTKISRSASFAASGPTDHDYDYDVTCKLTIVTPQKSLRS